MSHVHVIVSIFSTRPLASFCSTFTGQPPISLITPSPLYLQPSKNDKTYKNPTPQHLISSSLPPHFIYQPNNNNNKNNTSPKSQNPMKTNSSHEVKEMVTCHLHLHHRHGKEEYLLDLSSVAPPRISFSSSDFLDDKDFISINPKKPPTSITSATTSTNTSGSNNGGEFEFFFSGNNNAGIHTTTMLTADELFYDGKLLPFCQKKQQLPAGETKKKKDVVVKEVEANKEGEEEIVVVKAEENSGRSGVNGNNKNSGNTGHCPSWYFDEDPSPRPPKCTVLWKELLRLKKQRASSSSLSPSSSSSSTSSSSSSMADVANADDKKGTGGNLRELYLQRIRKGLERTRSGSIRIRPILNVPVCTHHVRTNSNGGGGLPPMFPTRKGRSV